MTKGQRSQGSLPVTVELPYGTQLARGWPVEWVDKVREAEARVQKAICGAHRKARDDDGEQLPCMQSAGHGTDHKGEGRCIRHDGGNANLKHGRYSLIRHRQLSSRIEDYLDSQELFNLGQAIATAWAVIDELLGDDELLTPDRVNDVVSAMRGIAGMIKQHHDMTEGQKIVIEVPQFMAWAEDFYVLAIRYIKNAGGDVGGFLREAQNYYATTVGQVVDVGIGGDGPAALGNGGPSEAEDALRPELEEP